MKKIGFFLLIASLIIFIWFVVDITDKNTSKIEQSNDQVLIYQGPINTENFIKLQLKYNEATIKPTLLRIDSDGGSIEDGIVMGYWIHAHNISVEVNEMCASSCANYVFAAGKQKILGANALLLFHEGPYQLDLPSKISSIYHGNHKDTKGNSINSDKGKPCKVMKKNTLSQPTVTEIRGLDCIEAMSENLQAWKLKESFFYDSLEIDPNYPYYGQNDPRYTHKDSLYLYSLSNLKAMGLKNIILKDGQWTPEQSAAFTDKLFIVEPDFPDFSDSPAKLAMKQITQFNQDNEAILPSHKAWFFLDPTFLTKHQNILADLRNLDLEKRLLSRIKKHEFGLENVPSMVICGQKECEIQWLHPISYAEFKNVDVTKMIGIRPLTFSIRSDAGILMHVDLGGDQSGL